MAITFIKSKKAFLSLPFKLILIITGCFIFGDYIPENVKSLLLAISLSSKNILLFILPLIVFAFSFYSFAKLKSGLLIFTILLSLVCTSNFLAVMFSYFIGIGTHNFIAADVSSSINSGSIVLNPLFELILPKLCDNSIGLALGILLGIYASYRNNLKLKQLAKQCSDLANKFLHNVFIPILPLFIFGFMIKLQHTGTLNTLFKNFMPLLLVIICSHIIYVGFAYLTTMNFNVKSVVNAIQNIIPATIVGFSTMSSAAAMPVLAEGAAKNAKDPSLAQTIVPSVINIHMLGDALGIPLMALSLYCVQYHEMPGVITYLAFAFSYMIAKFAAAGVPGGTIIVIIPVLESSLKFSPEMSAIILMMYILFDPFCTMTNVLGNGLFSIVFEKIWRAVKKNIYNEFQSDAA